MSPVLLLPSQHNPNVSIPPGGYAAWSSDRSRSHQWNIEHQDAVIKQSFTAPEFHVRGSILMEEDRFRDHHSDDRRRNPFEVAHNHFE
jgi:hypothetical protein